MFRLQTWCPTWPHQSWALQSMKNLERLLRHIDHSMEASAAVIKGTVEQFTIEKAALSPSTILKVDHLFTDRVTTWWLSLLISGTPNTQVSLTQTTLVYYFKTCLTQKRFQRPFTHQLVFTTWSIPGRGNKRCSCSSTVLFSVNWTGIRMHLISVRRRHSWSKRSLMLHKLLSSQKGTINKRGRSIMLSWLKLSRLFRRQTRVASKQMWWRLLYRCKRLYLGKVQWVIVQGQTLTPRAHQFWQTTSAASVLTLAWVLPQKCPWKVASQLVRTQECLEASVKWAEHLRNQSSSLMLLLKRFILLEWHKCIRDYTILKR